MRFVPNIANNRFPTTQSRVRDVVKMVGKQKKIVNEASGIHTDTICGLHYYVPQIGYTLCQILMSMRSANDPETQLFMVVDERMWSTYAVTFTVHKDRKAEANSLIPLLNVVMEAKFGARIWEWFTDTAKDASQGYMYDNENGRLKHTDEDEGDDESSIESEANNEFVQELSETLNISSTMDKGQGDLFDLDLSFMLDDDNPNNQYGDSCSVKSFRSTCQPKRAIEKADSDEETDYEQEKEDNRKKKAKLKSTKEEIKKREAYKQGINMTNKQGKSPEDMSVDTSYTQETSTITDSMSNPELAFA
jgi:hypothetical protein